MSALALIFALLGVTPVDCGPLFVEGLRAVERAPTAARVRPALEALARCPALGALGTAAASAAAKPRATRSHALVVASGLDAACAEARCQPLPPALELAPRALADADAGSYAFALAAHRALTAAGMLTPAAERILLNLLLAAALEGEAARTKGS